MTKKLLAVIAGIILLGAGCAQTAPAPAPAPAPVPAPAPAPKPTTTTITYYLTPNADDQYQYCNGADMDSGGYRVALKKKVTEDVPGTLTTEQQIIQTLMRATNASSFALSDTYTRVASTTFDAQTGIITMRPGSGWAGVSIFMCAWQPFVEKQLSQFPEVKQVKWEAES